MAAQVNPEGAISIGTSADNGDLAPFCGAACCITSFFCKWPDCLGIQMSQECLWFKQDALLCKCGSFLHDREVCICQRWNCACVRCEYCLKQQNQCFCLDIRCALPNTPEIPCLLNIAGLNLCYTWSCKTGCCKKLSEIRG